MTVQGNSVTLPTGSSSYSAIDTGTTLVGGPSDAIAAIFAQIPGSAPGTGQYEGYYSYREIHLYILRLWMACSCMVTYDSLQHFRQRVDVLWRPILVCQPRRLPAHANQQLAVYRRFLHVDLRHLCTLVDCR